MDWSTIPGCIDPQNAASLKCLEAVFINILAVVTGLAGLSLFVMLVIGGFRFLTSAGDPKASEGAKNTMTWAFIGMALMGLAYLIFSLIGSFSGVGNQILHFSIPDFPAPSP